MTDRSPGDERQFVETLMANAEQERRRVLDRATGEARAILEQARGEIERLRVARLEHARRDAEADVGRQVSQARFECVAERARVIDEGVRAAVDQARGVLAAEREQPGYEALLGRLLDECLAEVPRDGPLTLVIDARDRSMLDSALETRGERGCAVEVAGPFLGGLKTMGRGGQVVVDNTLETRLRAKMPEIRTRLSSFFSTEAD